MAEMGLGYGSECHLLRYLGRRRKRLDRLVLNLVEGETVSWVDCSFDPSRGWLDGELKGLEFVHPADRTRRNWSKFWPQRGNPPNWDAVARIRVSGVDEWLLVEAKANIQELKSSCKADAGGRLPMITRSLAAVKLNLRVAEDRDWLNGYYQYCNRIAVLDFLNRQNTPARMMFIYFIGE